MAPLVLLIGAAAIDSLRLPVLLGLLVGSLVTARMAPHRFLVWAGCLIVALNLAWGSAPQTPLIGGASCAERLAPFAAQRVIGAILVLGCVGVVMRLRRMAPSEVGLRWPSRGWLLASVVAVPLVGLAAIFLGPVLAEPFFGPLTRPTAGFGGLVAAILFALANASMEEVAFRGALMRWLAPATGVVNALALQALVFGLAHGTGADFIGSPLPVMAATAAAALVLGVLAIRTRSLLLPIAIHVVLDIPVFFGKACLGS